MSRDVHSATIVLAHLLSANRDAGRQTFPAPCHALMRHNHEAAPAIQAETAWPGLAIRPTPRQAEVANQTGSNQTALQCKNYRDLRAKTSDLTRSIALSERQRVLSAT